MEWSVGVNVESPVMVLAESFTRPSVKVRDPSFALTSWLWLFAVSLGFGPSTFVIFEYSFGLKSEFSILAPIWENRVNKKIIFRSIFLLFYLESCVVSS